VRTDSLTASTLESGALTDALERIGPALGASTEADEVRAALRGITQHRGLPRGAQMVDAPGQRQALTATLDRLARNHPEVAADVDAIRLALGATDAERMHKP
jgi:hypothetical protein